MNNDDKESIQHEWQHDGQALSSEAINDLRFQDLDEEEEDGDQTTSDMGPKIYTIKKGTPVIAVRVATTPRSLGEEGVHSFIIQGGTSGQHLRTGERLVTHRDFKTDDGYYGVFFTSEHIPDDPGSINLKTSSEFVLFEINDQLGDLPGVMGFLVAESQIQ